MEHYDNQYDNNNWQAPTPPPQPPVKQQNNMALASMIVGIFGLLSCCLPPLQFVLGMVSLLLVIFSKKGQPFSGFAIAGLVMSIFCLVISIVMAAYMILSLSMLNDPSFAPILDEIMEIYGSTPAN